MYIGAPRVTQLNLRQLLHQDQACMLASVLSGLISWFRENSTAVGGLVTPHSAGQAPQKPIYGRFNPGPTHKGPLKPWNFFLTLFYFPIIQVKFFVDHIDNFSCYFFASQYFVTERDGVANEHWSTMPIINFDFKLNPKRIWIESGFRIQDAEPGCVPWVYVQIL